MASNFDSIDAERMERLYETLLAEPGIQATVGEPVARIESHGIEYTLSLANVATFLHMECDR